MKLRTWVKVGLIVIIMVSIISACNDYTNKAVNQCINAGHTRSYCESGLR